MPLSLPHALHCPLNPAHEPPQMPILLHPHTNYACACCRLLPRAIQYCLLVGVDLVGRPHQITSDHIRSHQITSQHITAQHSIAS
jgi:hypothetical protein